MPDISIASSAVAVQVSRYLGTSSVSLSLGASSVTVTISHEMKKVDFSFYSDGLHCLARSKDENLEDLRTFAETILSVLPAKEKTDA